MLSVGIVGLPNVGKSTLFQTLTKNQVDRQNYPFCTIDPNVGVVAVPDERVNKLAEMSMSERTVYATVDFVDIAGLVPGAHKGEGLGNKFLAHIREVDTIVYVLRAFKNENIINTEGSVDPIRDKENLDTELILKDLETIEKRLIKTERELKDTKNKDAAKEFELLSLLKTKLEQGKKVNSLELDKEKEPIIKGYQLLTSKPVLYLLNGTREETTLAKQKLGEDESLVVEINVLDELESENMPAEDRLSLGLDQNSGTNILIKKSYDALGLITFLTTGKKETRAWQTKKGSKAPKAAAEIHTDFEKKFIRAEVINWQDLLATGSWAKAREKGLISSEGKEYVVKDGDVIEFRI